MTMPPLIPIEDLYANPERGGAQVSPDGTKLSFLAPENNRLDIWVQDLDGHERFFAQHLGGRTASEA